MFVDKVKVKLTAGKGGDGFVSFRREKYVERGGPDGGDGGDGGDIVIVASDSENTLAKFRYKKEVFAENGHVGAKRKKHGKSAPDLEVSLPVGTVIIGPKGKLLADLISAGQRVVVAKGGKGGYGNAHFVSSRRQAPKVAEKGEPGEQVEVTFELKMIADAGLIGLPNAGKSTLLARISNARPEVANYPFTTLNPHLGVVDTKDDKSFLVADIPGLIEGASQGKGLGDEFLRHVERTSVLVHLIDIYQNDISAAYRTIQAELKAYKVDLTKKPQIVAISKSEGMPDDIKSEAINQIKKSAKRGSIVLAISAQSGEGLEELIAQIGKAVVKARSRISAKAKKLKTSEIPIIKLADTTDKWKVVRQRQGFVVTGEKIERFAVRTDFGNLAGIHRLRDIMRKTGIMHELERRKINPGDKIMFGKNGDLGSIEY